MYQPTVDEMREARDISVCSDSLFEAACNIYSAGVDRGIELAKRRYMIKEINKCMRENEDSVSLLYSAVRGFKMTRG